MTSRVCARRRSEYNVYTAERLSGVKPPPSSLVSSGSLPCGGTTADLPTATDEATRARNEASAAQAAKPAPVDPVLRCYPRDMPLDRAIPVPLYSHPQLSNMSVIGLKTVATNLRDAVNQHGIPGYTLPPLLPSSSAEIVISWVLDVQIALASDAGLTDCSMASFNVPK